MRKQTSVRMAGRLGVVLAMAAALGGCELLYFLGGEGQQPALFDLPKNKRILILVDVPANTEAPPDFATTLADRIGEHLYHNQAADQLVGQNRIMELRRDDVKFRKMGVADIAKATDADVVLVVNMVFLEATTTSDGSVTQGAAQALVKVVDKNGERLWPGELLGNKVEAKVDPSLATDRDKGQVYKELIDVLTTRVGRIFHAYDKEDKQMNK